VITTGGLYGVIAGITDDIIQLKVAPNVKIEVSRNAIAGLQQEKGD
jgi:preprotein translocase YajC subunit